MNIIQKALVQLRAIWPKIIVALIPPTFILAVAIYITRFKHVPMGDLTRDINAIAGFNYYTGFVSQSGIFFWAGAATLCFFTYWMIRNRPHQREARFFLIMAGFFTLLLAMDDVFMFHEGALPHLGIPEDLVFCSYVGFTLFFMVRFCRFILSTNYLFFLIALGLFAFSMVVDVLYGFGDLRHLAEDGSKLLGIAMWLAYYADTCAAILQDGSENKR